MNAERHTETEIPILLLTILLDHDAIPVSFRAESTIYIPGPQDTLLLHSCYITLQPTARGASASAVAPTLAPPAT